MKRLPLLATVLALVALSASIAYWLMQLNPPPGRPLANAPLAVVQPPSVDAAATLFGGQIATAVVSNYVLTGVIASGAQGVAIIVADGGLPKALKIGRELAPGVTLNEVYPRYVTLLDNGISKRIDLAPDSKAASPMGEVLTAPVSSQPAAQGGAQGQSAEPSMAPGAVQQTNMMTGQPPQQPPSGPSPSNPGAVPGQPVPPGQVQSPPPTRNFATPATGNSTQ
ncbi:type II secretion system protein N [Massilia sp. S19_KUP03_FR1]|uniref:type II secretion system protein N n=1 Tax=Massilia sp. S19_KUP03_FR1 TaxID=3025503 RepID=UPI002FCDDFBC